MEEYKVRLVKEKEELPDALGGVFFFTLLGTLIIGLIFLIPPILGAIFFVLKVFNIGGEFASLKYLGVNWTGDDNAMSAAPIYLGLMAIAGVILIIGSIMAFIKIVKHYD